MIIILALLLTWALKVLVGTNAAGTCLLFILSLFTVATCSVATK